jgi:6-pyruvoyl-tetrahydropterin synthase-like protein
MSVRLLLALCAATIPASFGLLHDGFFSSSDGMIHLYRLFELDRAVQGGILFPRWFPLSGYGYGLPVLNYYPPFVYYLAEFFHLFGAGYIVSIKLLVALGFVSAALSMFLFVRDLLGAAPALVAGIAFAYLPYLLSDAYIRGNFPEFFAMSLIPFVLFAFRRLFDTQDQKYFALSAFSLTVIILSHHLTAMLLLPLVVAYIVFLFALNRNLGRLLVSASAILVSLALSAFYWVPAIAELNLVFVDPASIPRYLVSRLVGVTDFFAPSLAYGYLPQSQALVHTAGFPQTVIALFSLPFSLMSLRGATATKQSPSALTKGREGERSKIAHSLFFLLLLLLSIFMMLDWSAPLWYAIPTLRFMQFPWRFQVLAGISIAFLLGVIAFQIERIANYQIRLTGYSLSVLAIIALAVINLPVRDFPLTDAQLDLQHSADPDYVVSQMGWSWTREYVPVTVREETVVGSKARAGSSDSPRVMPSVRIENEGLLSLTLRVSTLEPFPLLPHTFYFPGWQASIDNAPAQTFASGELGLVAVNVAPGEHSVIFRFEETPLRLAMDIVSAFVLIASVARLAIKYSRIRLPLVAVALLLVSAVFLHNRAAPPPPQPIALDANFGNQALLIGYSTERSEAALSVTLYWLSLADVINDNYSSFVHLVSADGRTRAQDDSLTDRGVTPTSRWQKGEIVADRHTIALKDASSGQFRLIAGMYLPREDGYTNLPAFDRAGNDIGNEVELGQVQLGK